ncbi:hypothetical protein Q7C36_020617 [Tachysurus vachellii]|uniref:Uncharacterized protein n=1 Tax=Tachysurus vachellii TaxID=175792 RepID=A0AA88LKZ6_TACVA|nr:hypothetical protein Q7C36_020617 [Tachysurus vachellii]
MEKRQRSQVTSPVLCCFPPAVPVPRFPLPRRPPTCCAEKARAPERRMLRTCPTFGSRFYAIMGGGIRFPLTTEVLSFQWEIV